MVPEQLEKRGRIQWERAAAGVIYLCWDGHLSPEMAAPLLAVVGAEIESNGSVSVFVDGSNFRSYDSGFREAWTHFILAHRRGFEDLVVYTKSSVARLGLQILRGATGARITLFSTAMAFEASLIEMAPDFAQPTRRAI